MDSLFVVAICVLCSGFEWEGRIARLHRELDHKSPARRREVVRLLGTYPAPQVEDALMRALRDPDVAVRIEAAKSVGRARVEQAAPKLKEWLSDPNAALRTSAAQTLGLVGGSRVTPSLVRALGDATPEVRSAAVTALATIGDRSSVIPLLGRLDDDEVAVRLTTTEVLGELGDRRAVMPLIGRARDEAPEVRTAVFRALGVLGDTRAVGALVQGLSDTAEEVRMSAIIALGRLESPQGVEPLVPLVQGPDARAARAAISALAKIDHPGAMDAVLDALVNDHVQQTATQALVLRVQSARAGKHAATKDRAANSEKNKVAHRIAKALRNEKEARRFHALARALTQVLLVAPAPAIADDLLHVRFEHAADSEHWLKALASTGSPAVLIPLLERIGTHHASTEHHASTGHGASTAHNASTERAALEALDIYFRVHEPDGRAADPLIAALGRVSRKNRIRVVRLLGRLRAARSLDALRPLLSHTNAELRRATVEAIGAIGDPAGAPALLELLNDDDAPVRFRAAKSLSDVASTHTLRALARRLDRKQPTDRHAVLIALGGALGRSKPQLSVPPDVARRIAGLLLNIIRGDDDELAARAVDAARQWRDRRAVTLLLQASKQPALQTHAIFALGSSSDKRALAAIREHSTSRQPDVRAAAAASLGEHGTHQDAKVLLKLAHRQWPVSAAATFSLARMARRGALPEPTAKRVCALLRSRDPYVRANAMVALSYGGIFKCRGTKPAEFLEQSDAPRQSARVRVAAMWWLARAHHAGSVTAKRFHQAIRRCLETELSPDVLRVCAHPKLEKKKEEADVYVYASNRRDLLRNRLVAISFADGSSLLVRSDRNGHVRLSRAPRGPLKLEDPSGTRLESR